PGGRSLPARPGQARRGAERRHHGGGPAFRTRAARQRHGGGTQRRQHRLGRTAIAARPCRSWRFRRRRLTKVASHRILIADADPAAVQTVSWVLREQGYDVHSAADSETLFERLATVEPELLLLDGLTDGAGLDLLERIKGEPRWRDLPVLVVAEQPPEDAAVWTFGMGASDFLRKPFRVRELLARVEAQLRVRRMLVEAREALRSAEAELQRVRT